MSEKIPPLDTIAAAAAAAEYQEQAQPGQIHSGVSGTMSRGYRGILIALGWLISIGAGPPAKQEGDNPPQASNEKIERSLEDIAASLKKANEPSQHDKPCPEGNDERSSDLCAQWKAADSAKSAANAAWWIGGIGLLVGGLTLAAAWSAAKWAKKAAEYTGHSNAITIDAQRPWISIEVQVTEFGIDEERVRFSRVVKFTNIGQTVAENVRTFSDSAFIGDVFGVESEGRFEMWRGNNTVEGFALMPGESVEHWNYKDTKLDQIPWAGESADKDRVSLFVFAAAYYQLPNEKTDDKWHLTERSFRIGVKNANPAKQLVLSKGRLNSLTPETAVVGRSNPSRTT